MNVLFRIFIHRKFPTHDLNSERRRKEGHKRTQRKRTGVRQEKWRPERTADKLIKPWNWKSLNFFSLNSFLKILGRKTTLTKHDINKVNLIKFYHECSLGNILNVLRTVFLRNISKGLLLLFTWYDEHSCSHYFLRKNCFLVFSLVSWIKYTKGLFINHWKTLNCVTLFFQKATFCLKVLQVFEMWMFTRCFSPDFLPPDDFAFRKALRTCRIYQESLFGILSNYMRR